MDFSTYLLKNGKKNNFSILIQNSSDFGKLFNWHHKFVFFSDADDFSFFIHCLSSHGERACILPKKEKTQSTTTSFYVEFLQHIERKI